MDELNPQSSGQPPAEPLSHPPDVSAAGRAGRHPILWAILGLQIAAVLAAGAIIARGGKSAPSSGVSDGSGFFRTKKLLLASKEDGVGWVSIHGAIYHSQSGRVWDHGMEQWNKRINALADRSDVKAIILDIDSPGGTVGAVQELYDTVERVRSEKKKPVVAVVGDMAASGGFYLAAACDDIVAHPGSLLGSIGVIFNSVNVQQLFDKIGVKSDPIKSGKMKDIGSPTRKMTPEERALLQGIIDNAYGQFLAAVSAGRRLSEDKVRPLADGRIFTGDQAKQLGLIDVLGGQHEAIELAAKLGKLPSDKPPRIIRDTDSLEGMLGLLDSAFSGFLPKAASPLERLEDMTHMGLEYRWTGF